MNAQHDNHGPIEEMFDELMRETAATEPTDAQWQAAHGRLRRRLAEARVENAAFGKRGLPWLRLFAYGLSAAAAIAIISIAVIMSGGPSAQAAMSTPGQLLVLGPDGIPAGVCPLQHTDVEANVAGFIARVHVRQTFKNPFDRPIEAVYEFPLPHGSAVDEMRMRIGAREIVGVTKEKEEARQLYNAAKAAGQRTALLEQKRPNIFEQSVANIQPGERIEIEIAYTEVLNYVDGRFEFVFPMVIAPRYEPRPVSTNVGPATSPAMTPDGSPVRSTYADMTTTAPASRSGHDISVTVTIAGGAMPINQIKSRLHDVSVERSGLNNATVKLKNRGEIPNRDFVLDYTVAGNEIGDALFLRNDPRGRFFSVILAPPKRVTPKDVVPRELIFVVDQSGSMQGWKIEKAKLAMRRCIQNMNPGDAFNLLSFSGGMARCFEKPVPATTENVAKALAYIDKMNAGGGTEMMPAIREALQKNSAWHWIQNPANSHYYALTNPGTWAEAENQARAVGGHLVTINDGIENAWLAKTYVSVPHSAYIGLSDAGHENQWLWTGGEPSWPGHIPDSIISKTPFVEPFANWEDGEPNHSAGNEHVAEMYLGYNNGAWAGLWNDVDGQRQLPGIVELATRPSSDTLTRDTRTRIVAFMSDGEVGNDFEILSAVRQNAGTTRVFTFGVGDSVNRFLLETMAKSSRGEAQFVTEKDAPEEAADRFYVSLSAPVLSDVKLEWQGIQVEDVSPTLIPDLFDRRPVMIHGRIKKGSPETGTLTLTGMTGAGPFRRVIRIPADAVPTDNAALPSLWARSRVDEIMIENPVELQSGRFSPATREKILGLGLEYNLMTQFTSFVAVEKNMLAPKGEPTRVNVPAAAPRGEPRETIQGRAGAGLNMRRPPQSAAYFYTGAAQPQSNQPQAPAMQSSALFDNQRNEQYNYKQRQISAVKNQLMITATYDPTNGTNSSGDVYKVKDGGPSVGYSMTPAPSNPAAVTIGDRESAAKPNEFAFDKHAIKRARINSTITSAALGRIVASIPPEGASAMQKIDPALHADVITSSSDIVFVMVILTERTSRNLKAIQAAGLRIDVATSIAIRNARRDNPVTVPGSIERGNLMNLAKLKQVRYVAKGVGRATVVPQKTAAPYRFQELKAGKQAN